MYAIYRFLYGEGESIIGPFETSAQAEHWLELWADEEQTHLYDRGEDKKEDYVYYTIRWNVYDPQNYAMILPMVKP